MKWILKLIFAIVVNAAVLWALEMHIFPGSFRILGGTIGYPIVAITFAVVNTFIKPIIKVVTLPIHFLTLGAVSFLINGLLLWIVEWVVNFFQFFDTVFTVEGLLTYILAGTILGLFNTILHYIQS